MVTKYRLLAGVAVLVLASAEAGAVTVTFGPTGTVQSWRAPTSAIYRIVASGGRGGDGWRGISGGTGAVAQGRFRILSGTRLTVIVGGNGAPQGTFPVAGGGGGGASWVYGGGDVLPMLVAGGGGGGSFSRYGYDAVGIGGSGAGGLAWNSGGYRNLYSGGGGGGWNSDGGTACANAFGYLYCTGEGGRSRPSFAGGTGFTVYGGVGGFGGGGGGSNYSGGGGGGFTGGDGGSIDGDYGGRGGTSYVASWATDASVTGGSTIGQVSIENLIAIPEPASWAMLVTGFAAMGGVLRARRVRPA